MTGALAILFLLTVTLVIVRVAGVALRLTGLPQPVARFQAVSALTGTGFTTSEAEGTMHHPVRRRILTLLMFTGHLGLVSMTSTVILAMASTESSSSALVQILAMAAAIAVICALAISKTLDQIMCDWVQVVLQRLDWICTFPYEILYEHPDGFQLCEHIVRGQTKVGKELLILSRNGVLIVDNSAPDPSIGDRMVLYALPEDQRAWSDLVAPK